MFKGFAHQWPHKVFNMPFVTPDSRYGLASSRLLFMSIEEGALHAGDNIAIWSSKFDDPQQALTYIKSLISWFPEVDVQITLAQMQFLTGHDAVLVFDTALEWRVDSPAGIWWVTSESNCDWNVLIPLSAAIESFIP